MHITNIEEMLNHYCDFENGYIDCDKLTRDDCKMVISNNDFIEFPIAHTKVIDKKKYNFAVYKFRSDWLFENLPKIGYTRCIKSFEQTYWEEDIKELYELSLGVEDVSTLFYR